MIAAFASAMLLGERDYTVDVRRLYRTALSVDRDAAVARKRPYLFYALVLFEFLDDGVLSSAASYYHSLITPCFLSAIHLFKLSTVTCHDLKIIQFHYFSQICITFL